MIKIYGRITSSNVQTVMWAIAELDLEVERIDIGGSFGGNDEPSYLALNPNGLVPTMQDGELTLFEANAIVRYLVNKYGSNTLLRENDVHQNARNDMWMEWTKTTVYKHVIADLFMLLVRGAPAARTPEKITMFSEQTQKTMAIANAQLEKHQWLAGDKFTCADIAFGTLLFRYFEMDFKKGEFSALNGYYNRLKLRTAYVDNVMIDYSSLAAK